MWTIVEMVIAMEIPFDIERRAKEKLNCEVSRFFELYVKYEDDIDNILEFAELYKKFVLNGRNKWTD